MIFEVTTHADRDLNLPTHIQQTILDMWFVKTTETGQVWAYWVADQHAEAFQAILEREESCISYSPVSDKQAKAERRYRA